MLVNEENHIKYYDYVEKGYDALEKWTNAMYDISFTKLIQSKDELIIDKKKLKCVTKIGNKNL